MPGDSVVDISQERLSDEELALRTLCGVAVANGIAIADGTTPDFTSDAPEEVAASHDYVQELMAGACIPRSLAGQADALLILRGEVIACTNAAMAQRLRDRAWQRADGIPPWLERHVRRGWETLLMRLADAGFRIPGNTQTGLVAQAEAPECYRLAPDEFRTGWIAGESIRYQWCARRLDDTVSIGRRDFGSRSFETLLRLPVSAVERLATFLKAVA